MAHGGSRAVSGESPATVRFAIDSLGGGGAERMVVNLLRTLDRRRFRPSLLLLHPRDDYAGLVPRDVPVDCLEKRGRLDGARLVAALTRRLRAEPPAVLCSFLTYVNLLSASAWSLAGRPCALVVVEQNAPRQALDHARLGGFKRGAARFLYPHADRVIAISEGVRGELIAGFGIDRDRCVAIPNSADLDEVRRLAAEPCDHPWLAEGGAPVVVACGRLTRQKNYPLLLAAVQRLTNGRDVRLIVLGEGEERGALESQAAALGIRERVDFAGFKRNPFALIARAHAFALSSSWEGMANVLVEAMACGTPVVTTDCPHGPCEVVRDGSAGLLVPCDDADALAAALGRLLDRPDLRRALAAEGLERARDYDVSSVTARYENVLQAAIAERR